MNITSAAGIISLLEEPMPELKIFALKKLDLIVDEFWPEISEAIQKIEILHEDKSFQQHDLAALVASKVYYHLGSFSDSLQYALGAGNLFNVNSHSEYVDTIIAKCIDHYTELRIRNYENEKDPQEIDPRLKAIVDRMFQRCLDDGQYKQALGLALETRRMDIFEKSIRESDDVFGMLCYAFNVAMATLDCRGFRTVVLRHLVQLYRNLAVPDYVNMCQCLIFLDDPVTVANVLEKLIAESEDSTLMAYQIAFDMYESATQQFLGRVLQNLCAANPLLTTTPIVPKLPTSDGASTSSAVTVAAPVPVEEPVIEAPPPRDVNSLTEEEKLLQTRVQNLSRILSGEVSIDLHLQFLIRSNHTDMLILKNTKDAIRVSICHTATVIANAFMHSGTTSDQFLRENLEWLARATNWAKLTATASLGVIHRGHEQEALALMQSYLPKEAGPSSGFSEGGGLYALGLIHANHGAVITEYLLSQLKDAQNEMVRHGGCLGLGLAAMGTNRQDVYEQLKFNLYQDDAVTGEAAGIAMGMVMLGSKSSQAIEDMVAYAQETQHEKILRGLAVGIALNMYGRLEEADALIHSLCQDKDPILRRSGMYTITMAYCGTGSNQAIRRLLHVAVSDVNDDVRRAAVTGLGFLLFRTPEQCPSVVSLLAESYNPHVRYGAAMALGIACAGTGLKEAIALLDPMTNDPVNFVRQGALIASAMILIQQTEQTCPKVKDFRTLYSKVIVDKHEDVMAKFGAILAQGIIDAGGRNVTLTLQSRTGHTDMLAVVGTLVFTQYWYWFPLSHCLALAFTPTCLIGLNAQLKMPKVEFRSAARPSTYAYPPPLEEKKQEEREKVTTAVLSIAARQRRRGGGGSSSSKQAAADSATTSGSATTTSGSAATSGSGVAATSGKEEKMEVDESKEEVTAEKEKKGADEKETKKEEKEEKEKKGKKEEKSKPEPNFEVLSNPARVMKQQLKVISLLEPNGRYVPLKEVGGGGIVMMRRRGGAAAAMEQDEEEEEELVEPVAAFGPKPEDDREPEPPEPFEYTED
ncbi:26S proteasome non-ATPase regulatory subunit 1 isoform X2 [Nilaparvata lugens]|uniref:26S proteasome non-ATPase regulatory subunit 1 isoform X1 n=1 Tax=Nilaparvata lugens TaxID=108931 RepID=UPI00193C9F19|nr:26S proteasome non-ATPase regulatory subunit 1 isoform X1 [Nilaparvata lugens]XP_039296979.1 26S proteasome non-ATPase regulatory subunit 1 isoform X2 [Nilaparvata lugens]